MKDEGEEVPEGYTAEQWERLQVWLREHPYGDQDENGVDLSLLRENLKLTPTARIEQMRRALAVAMELDRARAASRVR